MTKVSIADGMNTFLLTIQKDELQADLLTSNQQRCQKLLKNVKCEKDATTIGTSFTSTKITTSAVDVDTQHLQRLINPSEPHDNRKCRYEVEYRHGHAGGRRHLFKSQTKADPEHERRQIQ